MRRLMVAVIIAAVAAVGFVAPPPPPEPEPLAGVIIDRPGIESPADAAIWYCPWPQATTTRDTHVALMAVAPADADVTFPVLIPGETPDTASVSMGGPGASVIQLSSVAQRGHSPGFIEFEGGPSGAAVTVTGDILAADTCTATGGDEWFFAGGSTMTGDAMTLRLFNPFPETARLTVGAFSEIGVEALGDAATVTVQARSWRDIDFAEMLRQRQSLVVSVRLDRGLVVPAMSFTRGGDQGLWSGAGLSSEWEVPLVRLHEDDPAALIIANPGLTDLVVEVETYGVDAAHRELTMVEVAAGSPVRIEFDEEDHAVLGARVSAPSPVSVGIVSYGQSGTAVTAGAPERSTTWLLPAIRPLAGQSASLWLLNTSEDAIVVTVSRITDTEVFNVSEILDPGTVTRLPVVGGDTRGYLVRSTDPFSAAWSIEDPVGLGISIGIPAADLDG